ncbi:MAG: hypothetical protein MPJ50_08680 [Pirellulales bacterium]|nr:hypothetical protein [Pirellulales bacterium]
MKNFATVSRLVVSVGLACACVLIFAGPALALDTIRLAGESINGTIQSMTRDEVVIREVGNSEPRAILVDEIISISFSGAPAAMQTVVGQMESGDYNGMQRTLELPSLALDKLTDNQVKAEVSFCAAYAAARNALNGNGNLEAAGRDMRAYVDTHPNHWRYYAAAQALGELYSAVGAEDEAIRAFALLRAAPSKEIKLNGAMAQAQSMLASGQHEGAMALFKEVLDDGGSSELAKVRLMTAEVGLVACQAQLGQAEEGIKIIKNIIDEGDAENASLFAMAYTALGNCHLAKGENKDALLAFLHVELLYPSQSRYRAEALYHLSRLWGEVGQGERAVQARQILLSTYSDSVWARKSEGR